MIISRKMADEAAATLGIDLAAPGCDKTVVQLRFREVAKDLHPDKGGNPAEFIVADRAKCILEQWLARAPEAAVDPAIASTTCPRCGGSGRLSLQRGFRSMTMICGTCRGHGEIVPTEKVEE